MRARLPHRVQRQSRISLCIYAAAGMPLGCRSCSTWLRHWTDVSLLYPLWLCLRCDPIQRAGHCGRARRDSKALSEASETISRAAKRSDGVIPES